MSYFGEMMLNYLLRGQNVPAPPTPWLALFVEGPGGVPVEASGGGYERVDVSGMFAAPQPDDSTFNSITISFPTPTLPWGRVIGAAIFDAQADGNLVIPMFIEMPIEIPAGPPVYFNPGMIRIGIEATAAM